MNMLDQLMSVMDVSFDPEWGEAWNRRQVEGALSMANTRVILVDATGCPLATDSESDAAGFSLVRFAPGEEELLLIAVRPELRGKGLGQRLIALLSAEARSRGATRIFLEMRENNPAASLYTKVGFEPIGRRKSYYLLANGSRMDAITYGLTI